MMLPIINPNPDPNPGPNPKVHSSLHPPPCSKLPYANGCNCTHAWDCQVSATVRARNIWRLGLGVRDRVRVRLLSPALTLGTVSSGPRLEPGISMGVGARV